jgi:hypothetical protein
VTKGEAVTGKKKQQLFCTFERYVTTLGVLLLKMKKMSNINPPFSAQALRSPFP